MRDSELTYRIMCAFCRAMLCISTAYAIVRCLSVRLSVWVSVTFMDSVETSKHLLINFFSHSGSHTILVFLYQTIWQYSDWDPLTGRRMQGVWKKLRFSTNVSLYLGNDTRQGHSYYGTPIGTRMRSIKWCQFQLPLMTLTQI